MKKLEPVYKLKYENFIWAKIASGYVLIVLRKIPDRNFYMPCFAINKPAADTLDRLLRGENSQSIIRKLAKNNHISIKTAARDFKALLAVLKKLDLIY